MKTTLRAHSLPSLLVASLAGICVFSLLVSRTAQTPVARADVDVPVPSVLTLEADGLRYTYHVLSGSEALFDLRQDPGTLRNLLPGRAPDALRMRRELEAKLKVASLEVLRKSRRRRIEELKALGYL